MLFGGYEHWMLRFWTLRKLDATLLDALIATRTDVRFLELQAVPSCSLTVGSCEEFPFVDLDSMSQNLMS